MNILILSSGTRVKLIEYFVEVFHEKKAKVYTADCSTLAPSLYVSDDFFIVPRINDPNYIESIIDICKQNNIRGVLSLIDPELSLISNNERLLKDNSIIPIVSSNKEIEICFDKMLFYEFCKKNNIPTIETIEANEIATDEFTNYPYFAKPKYGSASLDMFKIYEKNDLKRIKNKKNYIIQEFIDGKEYGVDVYVDMISGEIIDIFIKEKIKMRAGETDKSISIDDYEIKKLVIKLLSSLDLRGPIDIDIFKNRNNQYIISEVNPRFGGGYLHAHESGCNFPRLLHNNLNNQPNDRVYREYKKSVMMKYSDIIFKENF